MGIKKYAPYRKDGSNWDQNRATRLGEIKAKIKERRAKMMGGQGLESYDEVVRVGGEGTEKPAKKRKGKKERQKAKVAAGGTDGDVAENAEDAGIETQTRNEKRTEEKLGKRKTPENEEARETQEGPSKKKRRRHKKAGHTQVETTS